MSEAEEAGVARVATLPAPIRAAPASGAATRQRCQPRALHGPPDLWPPAPLGQRLCADRRQVHGLHGAQVVQQPLALRVGAILQAQAAAGVAFAGPEQLLETLR